MSTFVAVNTYSHTTTYITDKMLLSLLSIIRLSGLSPAKLADDWKTIELGIRTWLGTRDLRSVTLEVFNPLTNGLVGRWDFDIIYDYGSDGSGGMWTDTDAIKYAIAKAGVWPSQCDYRIVTDTNPNRPDVPGWSRTSYRSTDGFARHSIGTTIGAVGAGSGTAYWRKS